MAAKVGISSPKEALLMAPGVVGEMFELKYSKSRREGDE
jgi:hypothetical protein